MSLLFADLAIPITVDKLFTYSVPVELQPIAKCGARAMVPFGKRSAVGIIVHLHSVRPPIPGIKAITDVLDREPILSKELLTLTRWIADYYFAPWSEVLKAAVVRGAIRTGKRIVKAAGSQTHSRELLSAKQVEILRVLETHHSMTVQRLQKKIGLKSIYSLLHEMVRLGLIIVEERHIHGAVSQKQESIIMITDGIKDRWRTWLLDAANTKPQFARQRDAVNALLLAVPSEIPVLQFLKSSGISLSTLRTLKRKRLLDFGTREVVRTPEYDLYESSLGAQHVVLNVHQQNALEKISGGLQSTQFHAYLLHGVTGSGKTQVYIEAIRETLRYGKTAIVLVPEISLTPQIVRRFKYHFGETVVALHSNMSPGERHDAWRLTQAGKYSIVIGPRSAVFAPLNNLGLIVVDEEQEASYKQFDQTPRYHARDVAVMRANLAHAVVVLGSATPSLESYANALQGKYILLELPERVDNARLPKIEIIDMAIERERKLAAHREERKIAFREDPAKARADKRKFEFGMISDTLREHIAQRLEKKEGIILLQNRRGFAPIIECRSCGYVETCNNCNISLTYHLVKRHLRCHYCGSVKQPADVCPKCNGNDIHYRGFGTQRIEEELIHLFPQVRLLRMDLDTTSRKGDHDRLLRSFSEREADILLGTQMVAKGLDFSHVTLVGVISADTQMFLPDFRSAERTFQLLTQVAGRAGRRALEGKVIIQTLQPLHYSLRHVLSHDFRSFYCEEVSYRKELHYPPFSRVVLIECRGKQETEVTKHAGFIADRLNRQKSGYIVLGPAPAAITKINKLFRWHIVVKDVKRQSTANNKLHAELKNVLAEYTSSTLGKKRSVTCIIDVDPVGMM